MTWLELAPCISEVIPTDWFYPNDDNKYEHIRSVVSICSRCPVRAECLDDALQRKDEEGFWGGTLPQQRKKLIKYRKNLDMFDDFNTRFSGTLARADNVI